MTHNTRTADVPLQARRAHAAEQQRELSDGLTRRHLINAIDGQRYAAAQFARILGMGPTLAAKLRGE